MERRAVLKGAVAGAAALLPKGASAEAGAPVGHAGAMDLAGAMERARASMPRHFDQAYTDNVIVPFFLTSLHEGERPSLPMIDVTLTKENALPPDLWGLIYDAWKPTPEDGGTLFLQGLENRGDANLRKRIYMSALTADLYGPMYAGKVAGFFEQLFAPQFAGKPFMRHYLDHYFDLYWDLHLGVKGDQIPQQVRTIGESFNTVLAFRDPTQPIVHDNYMRVRALRRFLKTWIGERLDDVAHGRIAQPEKTIAFYWLKNAGNGAHFSRKDVIFECFHNFVALSQWGNTIFGIMLRLSRDGGDADVRAAFEHIMRSDYDNAGGAPYPPLTSLVMELFRVISPNGGSISTLVDIKQSQGGDNYGDGASPAMRFAMPYAGHGFVIAPHAATSFDPKHWTDPQKFDPTRYRDVPTSAEVDEAFSKRIGFARCPFERTTMKVDDGRDAVMANSAFGTVFGVVDGKPLPVCDYAGFAPFGFGYRRCPGEQLTTKVFEDFLRKVWRDKIAFKRLNLPNPRRVPVGPVAVIADDIGFFRST